MAFIGELEDFLDEAIIANNNTLSLQELLHLDNSTFGNISGRLLADIHAGNIAGNTILILAYSLLFLVSMFGNSIVCYVIIRNKRLHTVTNLFIANLAISDIMVSVFNIPFNIARYLLDDWPFGNFLCQLVNFSLMTSVYVSTFTLAGIALDRHQVIMYPLSPRIGIVAAIILIVLIWIFAAVFSLPYGIYTDVQKGKFIMGMTLRCISQFPEPSKIFEQSLTVATLIAQYIIPLAIIGFTYGRIVQRLWSRTAPGAVTQNQQISHQKAKRKSIKMLIMVVIVFALCWMPLNLYHLLTDLHPDASVFVYNSTAFFICHWLAVSSTCYNPFIYCWLNEVFRREVKRRFNCCYLTSGSIHPGVEIDGVLIRFDHAHKSRSRFLGGSTTKLTSTRRDGLLIEECQQSLSNSGGESTVTVCDNNIRASSPFLPRSNGVTMGTNARFFSTFEIVH